MATPTGQEGPCFLPVPKGRGLCAAIVMKEFNRALIEEYRANGGRLSGRLANGKITGTWYDKFQNGQFEWTVAPAQ